MAKEKNELSVVNDSMRMMPVGEMQNWYNEFVAFSKSIMKPDLDYGVIPGTPKPTLYKPGAEKLRFVYGLGVEMETIEKVADIDRPFIDYTYRCTVKSKNGQVLSQCEGNCNSLEPKFGYVWKTMAELPEGIDITNLQSRTTGRKSFEFGFAIDKGETTGQYGKPAEYWAKWVDAIKSGKATKASKKSKAGKDIDGWEMDETITAYRMPNPDVVGQKNTIMKMAQKRAFVGAILLATGASEFYTQDIEDMEINGTIFSQVKPVVEDAEIIPDTDKKETVPPEAAAKTAAVKQTPPPSAPASEKEEAPMVPGHWYAKLEKLKFKDEIDALAAKHTATLQAQPHVRELFIETRAKLPRRESAPAVK